LTTTVGVPGGGDPADLCDVSGGTPATATSTYDGADRATDAGYAYDHLGRTTAAPAGAVTGGAALTAGYFANDLVASLTQSGHTRGYTLDPTQNRPATVTDTAGPTITNHYIDTGDSPAWTGLPDGTWTRYVPGPAGGLAAITRGDGTVELQLANLHGDIVATCTPAATAPAAYFESTEYGAPRDTNTVTPRYGWLGTHQRDTTNTAAGLTLMGVRLYNPTTGRFLQTDPVPGGSCNDYDYTCADPINNTDLDGRCWIGRNPDGSCRGHNQAHWVANHKADIIGAGLFFIPVAGELAWAYRGYRAYRMYRGYRAARGVRFGVRLFRSKGFGGASRLFGNTGFGAKSPGLINRKGLRWGRLGWSVRPRQGGYSRSFRYRFPGRNNWHIHFWNGGPL
jgi:RHS repeat-associated protein